METGKMYEACVTAFKGYAEAAGFTDCVIGLSGGIDSSVVAAMSVDAFGAAHVHGVLLPGPYSSGHSVNDALELAANLGIDTRIIPIGPAYDAFKESLADACGPGGLRGLAAENTQARCRTVVLMALSNTYDWILVNTGNKSEAAMGYSTLYGDTAGGYAPIGGLFKTDVFAVGRWRNEQAAAAGEVPPIPQHVFDKPPSAELSEGQSDEAAMGIRYADLDRILLAAWERGATPEELAEEGFDADEVRRIMSTVERMAYKRAMEPPFPDVRFYE